MSNAPSQYRYSAAAIGLEDRLFGVYAQTIPSLVGNAAGAAVVLYVFEGAYRESSFIAWLAGFLVLCMLRGVLWSRFKRQKNIVSDLAGQRRWLARWNTGALISGAMWGCAAILLIPLGTESEGLLLILIIYSYCLASVPVLASQKKVFLSFAALCFVPLIAAIVSSSFSMKLEISVTLVLIYGLTVAIGRRFGAFFDNLISLKARAEQLNEQVLSEKAATEAAHLDAQQAYQEKLDFLRVTRDSLRNPLLVVKENAERLRSVSVGDLEIGMVGEIHKSIEVLDSLLERFTAEGGFGETVAGKQQFEVGRLWAAMAVEFEVRANAKRVALRFIGGNKIVYSDYSLLEKIVRILLDSALSYTSEGGIILCARYEGNVVKIQIWDTGPGWDLEGNDLVSPLALDELVEGNKSLATLAKNTLLMARKMAYSLGGDLIFRSEIERGSVYEIRLTRLQDSAVESMGPSTDHNKKRLKSQRVILYDHDSRSREDAATLLASWGAEVVMLNSMDNRELISKNKSVNLAIIGVSTEQECSLPGLVRKMRVVFGAALPIIVLATVKTSALVRQAVYSRFHLILRPIRGGDLWATVCFKLRLPWLDRDPTFTMRLVRDESYWSAMLGTPKRSVKYFSRVALRGFDFSPASVPAVAFSTGKLRSADHVILVHGGLSSSRSGFSDLLLQEKVSNHQGPWKYMRLLNDICVWRFEHESFVRVMRNVVYLVREVRSRIVRHSVAPGHIALIAHSRGGVVARLAAAYLSEFEPDWRIRVFTFGAPHNGTWVFRRIGARWALASNVMERLYKSVDGVINYDLLAQLQLVSRALEYDIPIGFKDVEPAVVARLIEKAPSFNEIITWGSHWKPAAGTLWSWDLLGMVVESVSGFEPGGDGLVAKKSAFGDGRPYFDVTPTFHTGYFSDAIAMEQLRVRLCEFLLRSSSLDENLRNGIVPV